MSSPIPEVFYSLEINSSFTHLKQSMESDWLGRQAIWIHQNSLSENLVIQMSAKIYSFVVPIVMVASIFFIPQVSRYVNYLNNLREFEKNITLNKKLYSISHSLPSQQIVVDSPITYLDGNCDNFLHQTFFKPYFSQIFKIISEYSNLNTQINLLQPGSFQNLMKEFYEHLSSPITDYSLSNNRQFYQRFIELLRGIQTELQSADVQADLNLPPIKTFLSQFIEIWMKNFNFFEQGMNFLYHKGLSKSLTINSMQDIGPRLLEACEQLKSNVSQDVVPGLYDPFVLGNIPYFTFAVDTPQKRVAVFRFGNVVVDEQKDAAFLTRAKIGEQFELFLDSYKESGKKHLYFNLMRRSLVNDNESIRSNLIENLEQKYADNLNVISLDRDSSFYKQSETYSQKNDSADFKQNFKNHLCNPAFYYWSATLNQNEWSQHLETIIQEIHTKYFHSREILTLEERGAFIELAYCMIIDKATSILDPDSCNYTCKSCIDRGGMTNAIMYLYYLLKQKGHIKATQFDYLLYLTFLPAILVANRQILPLQIKRLVLFANVFFQDSTTLALFQDRENKLGVIDSQSHPNPGV